MGKLKDINPIYNVYKGLENEIKNLKEIISEKFKLEMIKLGFRFVAEWIDYTFPILYRDVYLVYYNNGLYQVTFSSGTKMVHIATFTFQRFDTIDLELLKSRKSKTLLGYKINSENIIEKLDNKINHPRGKFLTYRDLLRVGKISMILDKDKS